MFSYSLAAPGTTPSGFGMVSDRFVLVVATTIGTTRALDVWRLATSTDASMPDLLDALLSNGLEALPDFSIIELVDPVVGSVTVAVRGRGVAHVRGDESHRLSGEGAGTWRESNIAHVHHMSVGLDSTVPAAQTLPLVRGVVLSDRVHLGVAEPAHSSPHESAPAAQSGARTSIDDDIDVTVLGRRSQQEETSAIEPLDEHTLLSRRTRPDVWGLVFTDGRTIAIGGRTVLGRSPAAGAGDTRTETLPSPKREVSSTHAELTATAGKIIVRDLGSTNGTIVTPAGGPARLLRGGDGVELDEGSSIDFGDANRAIVTRLS